MAEAQWPAEHGGAREVVLARLHDDRLVERLMLVPLVLAEEDPQQHRILGQLHGVRLPSDR